MAKTMRHVLLLVALGGGALAAQPPVPWHTPAWQWRVASEDRVPQWVALPAQGRIRTSEGLRLETFRTSGITYENVALGVLVGAMKNVGRCAMDLRVFLQYTDDRWRPMGDPIENEARVSRVEPGGVLPFRFRLRANDEFAEPPSGFSLHVHERGRALPEEYRWGVPLEPAPDTTTAPCSTTQPRVTAVVKRMLTNRTDAFTVRGEVAWEGDAVREDAVALTAVVFDKADEVLEVLTGTPETKPATASSREGRQVRRFTLVSPIPVGRLAARVAVHVEVLDDPEADSTHTPPR